jgi:hypothetical protein
MWEKADLPKVREYLVGLAKKRAQPKKAITEMVKYVWDRLQSIKTEEERLKVVEALKIVCDKKIYLEVNTSSFPRSPFLL